MIETTNDKKLLEDIFMILSSRGDYEAGNLWNSLSEEQKQEVLASESEIGNQAAWVSHEEMKRRNSEWLK